MTTRVLPREEWHKLPDNDLGRLARAIIDTPDRLTVAVVERGDDIIATWGLIDAPHLEGVWIKESERGGRVGLELWRGMSRIARARGLSHAFTGALTDDVRGLIHRLGGTDVPGSVHVMQFREEPCLSQP